MNKYLIYIFVLVIVFNINPTVSSANPDGVKVMVTANKLNVRDQPSTDAKVIGSLKKGSITYVLADFEGGEWALIRYNKKEGFISQKYIKTVKQDWQIYSNDRYNFSIKYPSNWTTGFPPTNGDGIKLFGKKPKLTMSLWGNNYNQDNIDEFYFWYNYKPGKYYGGSKEIKVIKLNNGIKSKVYLEKGKTKTHIHMLSIKNKVEYHVDTTVPNSYVKKTLSILATLRINE